MHIDPLILAKKIDLKLLQHIPQTSLNNIWIPPQRGNLKLNVDIAFIDAETNIAIGYIARNEQGRLIFAGSANWKGMQSCTAEDLLAACSRGIREQLKSIEIV
ncbi:hypothetical protein FRX31_015101 [Thalictrum thalictroides]|uniref:RNase H type-1 domain-containing protein n=1 Tax=Thalictrum thalictroides TaxID=46969 RepID=A0A7J6WEK4_THATH|nr:hypothetical protein FRX31_015101 [Thalictrum thalictroides]